MSKQELIALWFVAIVCTGVGFVFGHNWAVSDAITAAYAKEAGGEAYHDMRGRMEGCADCIEFTSCEQRLEDVLQELSALANVPRCALEIVNPPDLEPAE